MKNHFVIGLDGSGFDDLIRGVEEYERWLNEKARELVQRLADIGVDVASVRFENAAYDGVNDVSVNFEERGELTRAVVATGQAVLFIEFGAGATYGYGHPEPQGYGPGTYPGKGQGLNHYWFYTGQPGTAGGALATDPKTGYVHPNTTITHGNPPSAAMYNARKQLEEDFDSIAREVFAQ